MCHSMISAFMTIMLFKLLDNTASSDTGNLFPPMSVVVALTATLANMIFTQSHPKYQLYALILFMSWLYLFILPLIYVPIHRSATTQSVEYYVMTSTKSGCRQCLFDSQGLNYTLFPVTEEAGLEEGLFFQPEWNKIQHLSAYPTYQRLFKINTKSDWIVVLEDDAILMPSFEQKIHSILDQHYDVISLDTRNAYSWIFMWWFPEGTAGMAYNTRRLPYLAKLTRINSPQAMVNRIHTGKGIVQELIMNLCNSKKLRCKWAPLVKEFPNLPSSIGYS